MIYLQSATYSIFTVTLTENITINNPVFLFEFINNFTKLNIRATASQWEDLSPYPNRYNTFSLNLGRINEGSWSYNIYEMYATMSATLSTIDTTSLNTLEIGLANVECVNNCIKSYSYNPDINVYISPTCSI